MIVASAAPMPANKRVMIRLPFPFIEPHAKDSPPAFPGCARNSRMRVTRQARSERSAELAEKPGKIRSQPCPAVRPGVADVAVRPDQDQPLPVNTMSLA